MSRRQAYHRSPQLEALEIRLQLSAMIPANSIGTAEGTVLQRGGSSAASVTVATKNLTAGKSSTLFGVFVEPGSGSSLDPRIVGVKASDGRMLSIEQGRPFVAGRADGQAAAFVKVSRAGPLTVLVSGGDRSIGKYSLDVSLAGDANGDGSVNQSDLAPFAAAYLTTPGDQNYNAAADFNQNGIVNLYDAKALEENMPAPVGKPPLSLVMNLLPADQAHYSTPQNSGGATSKKDVTIVGRTIPGSIVLEDSTSGLFKWDGPAFATNSSGVFTVPETLTEGVNTFNFLVIDPFGRQMVRSYPIFWLPFAAPGSKLK
jgi:Dockerin type I domain